jgi:hypothetical protein
VSGLVDVFTLSEVALAVVPEPLPSVPLPALLPPLVQPSAVGVGPQRLKVTMPLGVPAPVGVPVTVAVSWTAMPGKTGPAVETWVAKVAEFCWLMYKQVTTPPGFSMIVAVLDDVVNVEPEVRSAVHFRFSKVNPPGVAPSLTV